jgi:hypothetical protein
MSWRGVYDRTSFLEPIHQRADALLAALAKPGLDRDGTRKLIAELDQIDAFVKAVRQVQGPAAELVPVTCPALRSGDLYMLQVGDWQAYYVLNAEQSMFYGALVIHPSMPPAKRLHELQIPDDDPP